MPTTPCDLNEPLASKQIDKNRHLLQAAKQYAPYAIFSYNAYEHEPKLPLPDNWSEVPALWIKEPSNGFACAVFERKDDRGQVVEAVIAFRGTDDHWDWLHQNLIPFRRDQVPSADRAFEQLKQYYNNQPVKLTATGHSLGGGLALHVSFTQDDVKAIVFNASPVTKAGIGAVQANHRVSIWESGEALQLVRNARGLTRHRWHDIDRIEFRFTHAFAISQHRMGILACNMIRLSQVRIS